MNKILIARRGVPLMKLDGINIFIAQIADNLISKGYVVTIAGIANVDVFKYRDLFGIESYPIFAKISSERKWRFVSDIEFGAKFYLYLLKNKHDFVIQNGIAFSPNKKTLLICHDLEPTSWPPILQKFFQKILYGNKFFKIAATSSEIRNGMLSLTDKNIHIVPTCISAKDVNLTTRQRKRITHVGTDPWKNPVASLELFSKLNISDSILTFIGDKNESLIHELNKNYNSLKNKVEFKSSLNRGDFLEILGESLYCLVPSIYSVGVLSPTVLDSYSQGTPVLASGISKDIFTCGETGFCLDPKCIEKALVINNWNSLSENAFKVARRFSVENSVERILNILNSKD